MAESDCGTRPQRGLAFGVVSGELDDAVVVLVEHGWFGQHALTGTHADVGVRLDAHVVLLHQVTGSSQAP
jgi:hypothetical protein